MRSRAVPKDVGTGFGQYATPKLTPETQLRVLQSPGSWHNPPEPETFKCVFGLGGFLNEMLCLVKDLTCVGSALPNSMKHILVGFLASRAKRRVHQTSSISPLLRPARCCSRCQQHASGCMQAPSLQELIVFEQRGEVCPAIQTCSQLMPCSLLPQLPLNRRTEGLPKSPFINSHTSCLESPSVAFRVFPGCVSNGNPVVLHECNNDSRHVSPHVPPSGCRTSRHHRRRNFCPDFSNVGPESVIVLPKDKPLPNEITRDLNCWVGIGMQECNCRGQTPASTSALCSFSRSCPRLLDP